MYYLTRYSLETQDAFMFYRNVNVKCPAHIHPQIEIVFSIDGTLTLHKKDKRIYLQKGTMSFIDPFEIHGYDTEDRSDMAVLIFPTSLLTEYENILSGSSFEKDVIPMSDGLLSRVVRLLDKRELGIFEKKALIYTAVAEAANASPLTDKKPVEYDIFHNALTYISENFSKNIRLSDTARHIGVTPEHLCRVLSDKTGFTFCEILGSMRVQKAKQLLLGTSLPVSEIAFEAGYGSPRNFNRAFKSFYGVTPTEMRKNTQ